MNHDAFSHNPRTGEEKWTTHSLNNPASPPLMAHFPDAYVVGRLPCHKQKTMHVKETVLTLERLHGRELLLCSVSIGFKYHFSLSNSTNPWSLNFLKSKKKASVSFPGSQNSESHSHTFQLPELKRFKGTLSCESPAYVKAFNGA